MEERCRGKLKKMAKKQFRLRCVPLSFNYETCNNEALKTGPFQVKLSRDTDGEGWTSMQQENGPRDQVEERVKAG